MNLLLFIQNMREIHEKKVRELLWFNRKTSQVSYYQMPVTEGLILCLSSTKCRAWPWAFVQFLIERDSVTLGHVLADHVRNLIRI